MEYAGKFYVIASALLLVAVLAFPVIGHFAGDKDMPVAYVEEVTETTEAASSGKICWGLKRGTNGNPPEVGSVASKLLTEHNGLYIGNVKEKYIYLTFDEGYENGYTDDILDTLREKNVKAIFFITGDYFQKCPELIRRMVEEGHEVGNHTVNHPSLADISRSEAEYEILELSRQFKHKYNKNMRFLRPPKGEYDEAVMEISENLSMRCLMWSFAYQDWLTNKQRGSDYALKMVTENLHNGAVLLLHAVSSDNTEALGDIIDAARKKGFEFGTPDQLYGLSSRG
ncbi:MAG: polysaccharide deacetylase [Ruminococcaceae bacterium]|nr:polysaccharide deacetylase [Oscillospiraceae bacterium]